MKIDYFVAADAANNGPDGKLNALGIGARILTYDRLPGATPLVLLLSASAMSSEAGSYPIELVLVEPDGTRETLVSATGTINSEVADTRIPTGLGVVLNLVRPYRIEGVHRFEARVGDLTGEYEVLVRLAPGTAGT